MHQSAYRCAQIHTPNPHRYSIPECGTTPPTTRPVPMQPPALIGVSTVQPWLTKPLATQCKTALQSRVTTGVQTLQQDAFHPTRCASFGNRKVMNALLATNLTMLNHRAPTQCSPRQASPQAPASDATRAAHRTNACVPHHSTHVHRAITT